MLKTDKKKPQFGIVITGKMETIVPNNKKRKSKIKK